MRRSRSSRRASTSFEQSERRNTLNLGTLCYIIGFAIAAAAVFGFTFGLPFGQDPKTILVVLMFMCLAPLVSGVTLRSPQPSNASK